MFRSSLLVIVLTGTIGFGFAVPQNGSLVAQDNAAAAAQEPEGFQLKPNVIVQEPMDEGSLTEKASFFIGFNLMTNLNRQKKNQLDLDQLFEGMKAASDGTDHESFIAGYQLMKNIEQQGAELQLEKIFAGIKSASAGEELGMEPEEVRAMMTSFGKLVEQKQMVKLKKLSDVNLAAGAAFMAKNKADNPNVQVLDNGVQYEVLVDGDGPVPTAENRVKVDYHGMFLDGTVFDSSIDPPSGDAPKPAEFQVVEVVPGFSKVLQSMKVGSKWRVVIPGPEGYKMAGRGQIGPNQALVFEISLLEILN